MRRNSNADGAQMLLMFTSLTISLFIFVADSAILKGSGSCCFCACCFAALSILSLYRSPKRSKCGLMTIVYFTNSFIQFTSRSRLPLGMSLLPPSGSFSIVASVSAFVNCVYALGIEL